MKRIKLLGWILVLTGCLPLSLVAAETLGQKVINATELTQKEIEEFSTGKILDVVLKWQEGAVFPLTISAKGQFLAMETNTPVKVLKTCYMRRGENGDFQFSTDMEKWEKVADFFTGEVKASMEKGMRLEVELNQRMFK